MTQPVRHNGFVTVKYHYEDGTWWGATDDATPDDAHWIGVFDTLGELRVRAAEGVRFMATDGGEIEPPARTVMFWHIQAPDWVTVDPVAQETFAL